MMGAKRAARGAINSFFKHSWHYKFHFWLCFHINLSSLCTFKRGSCKIIWAISLENNYSTKDFLYWPDWCFISSPTTKLALSLSKLGIKLRLVFNHAWLQTLMEEPFPILQIKSCLRTTSEPWILGTLNGTRIMPKLSFHDLLWWEIFSFVDLVNNSILIGYQFPILLPSMTWLKVWRCQKPIPPNSFFIVNFSQLI